MLSVALKGLAGRKVRASLTAIAIVLGVAMISGTYILTDTINNAFNHVFTTSYRTTSAIISACCFSRPASAPSSQSQATSNTGPRSRWSDNALRI